MSTLRDEVEALRKKIADEAYEKGKVHARSWAGRTQYDLAALRGFLAHLRRALGGLHGHIVRPAARVLLRPAAWLWRLYRRLWDWAVHYEDAYQNRRLSKTRAGVFLLLSAGFAWYAFVPAVVLFCQTILYFSTVKRDEIVYLTNSQEIMPHENEHSVQGCHALPCTDQNSIYFRIRANNFNEIWSILSGRGLFYPDYVAASVPVAVSRCKITSYGLRIKFLIRGLDIYPDLLQTECAPLGEQP
ncbi:MAG: hypothetical protein AB7S92_22785 [Parvibaculaceae bacterium]